MNSSIIFIAILFSQPPARNAKTLKAAIMLRTIPIVTGPPIVETAVATAAVPPREIPKADKTETP